MKRAKIAAVQRGSTLRDLVAAGLRLVLGEQVVPESKRMVEAPIVLPNGKMIPIRSNAELAALLEHEDLTKFNDVYR
jgi:hypothetical protein